MSHQAAPNYARVSNESVRKHTGRDWPKWFQLLGSARAENWDHRTLVGYLAEKHRLTPWWRQMVAIGYEIYLGKRVEGRNLKGKWSATITKSIPIKARALWDFMMSAEGLALWLEPLESFQLRTGATFECIGGEFGEVRTFLAPKRLRLKMRDTERPEAWILQVWVVAKPGGKCILVFTPENLATGRERESQRIRFQKAAAQIAAEISRQVETPKKLARPGRRTGLK